MSLLAVGSLHSHQVVSRGQLLIMVGLWRLTSVSCNLSTYAATFQFAIEIASHFLSLFLANLCDPRHISDVAQSCFFELQMLAASLPVSKYTLMSWTKSKTLSSLPISLLRGHAHVVLPMRMKASARSRVTCKDIH